MAIDFRTYQDPGVRVEVVDSPVLDTAGLEPTIVALVGKSQGSQEVSGGAFLYTSQPTLLADFEGISPSDIHFQNQRQTSSYYSAVIGRVIKAGVELDGNYNLGIDPDDEDNPAYITPYIDLPVFTGSKLGGTPVTNADASTAGKYSIKVGVGPDAQEATLVVVDPETWRITGLSAAVEVGQVICLNRTYQTPAVSIAKTGSPLNNSANPDWVQNADGTWNVKVYYETQPEDLPNIFRVEWETVGNAATYISSDGVGGDDKFKITIDLEDTLGQHDASQESALITVGNGATDTIDADQLRIDIINAISALILYDNGPDPDTLLTDRVDVYDVDEYGFTIEFAPDVVFETTNPVQITSTDFDGPNAAIDHGDVTHFTTIPTDGNLIPRTAFSFLQVGNGLNSPNERLQVLDVISEGTGWQLLHVIRGVQGSMINLATPLNTSIYHIANLDADINFAVDGGYDGDLTTDYDNFIVIEILDDGVRTPRITATSTPIWLAGRVAPESYYAATSFRNLQDIQEKYGAEWTSAGNVINSDLTLASSLAIANGATQLVCLAVEPDVNGEFTYDQWVAAVDKLAYNPEVNVIVPLIDAGSADGLALVDYMQTSIRQQANEGILRRVFIGYDGLSYPYGVSSYKVGSQQIANERFSLVAPGYISVHNGTASGNTSIPGYFAAAAVTGLQSIIQPQEPLTRKQIYGLTGVERMSSTDSIDMQSSGVLVLWQDRFGRIIIKHGLTTDMSTVYTREASIITARDRLRDLIYDTLDKGGLIGSPMTSDTPNQVMGGVTNALDTATGTGLIFDYSDVVYRINPIEPTAIEIRFAYKPTMPLNYIIVQFHIDTTVGTLEFQSIGAGNAGISTSITTINI